MTGLWGYGLCFGATLVMILGDYAIKLAADRGTMLQSPQFLVGGVLYALSAVGWYLAMRQMTLAQTGVASAIFSLLALCAMGVLLFEETLAAREYLGIAMAVGALVLMTRSV